MRNEIIETIQRKISGEPHITHSGGRITLTASHRLPSSGSEERLVFRILGIVGAAAILVAHYRPETALGPDSNVFLVNANTVVVGLLNAFGKLGDVAAHQSLDVPMESLRGWLLALLFLGGVFAFRYSGLFDLYTWLTNREHVRIIIGDEALSVRHSLFRFPKRIARRDIEDILILENHRTGHDVMVQHEGGLTRLASIYGNKTRPTLFKLRLEQALADSSQPAPAKSGAVLQSHN